MTAAFQQLSAAGLPRPSSLEQVRGCTRRLPRLLVCRSPQHSSRSCSVSACASQSDEACPLCDGVNDRAGTMPGPALTGGYRVRHNRLRSLLAARAQALPVKWGGLGLLSARYEIGVEVMQVADLSSLVSSCQTQAHVSRLLPSVNDFGSMERGAAIRHILSFFPNMPNR